MSSNKKNLKIKFDPTDKQRVCWKKLRDNITEFVMFGGGAGGGKSWNGCEWLLYLCLLYPGIKLFLGRNQLKRIMTSTYITWLKVCKQHGIKKDVLWKLNAKYNYIEFINTKTRKFDNYGSIIDLLDVAYQPSDPLYERFGSMEFTSGWLEEVGEIHVKAFDVLKSRINRHQVEGFEIFSKMLLTCNPKKNWTYSKIYKPWRDTKQKDGITFIRKDSKGDNIVWAFIQALHKDNPYTASKYGKQLAAIEDKILRNRLKDGIWEYENDEANLFEYEAILDVFTNDFINYKKLEDVEHEDKHISNRKAFDPDNENIDEYMKRVHEQENKKEDISENYEKLGIEDKMVKKDTEMYLTVDVARFGRDKSVFTLWDGLMIVKIWELDKDDLQPTEILKKGLTIVKEKIRKIRKQYHVPSSHVIIDADGLGGGVVDDVYSYKGFVNNSKQVEEFNADEQETKKYNYKNLKSQCWYTLAEYVNNHKIGCYKDIPEDIKMRLIEDLEVMKRKDYAKDELSLMVISKEDIKEAIGRSPDYGDTLMMRMYFELGKPDDDFEYGVIA